MKATSPPWKMRAHGTAGGARRPGFAKHKGSPRHSKALLLAKLARSPVTAEQAQPRVPRVFTNVWETHRQLTACYPTTVSGDRPGLGPCRAVSPSPQRQPRGTRSSWEGAGCGVSRAREAEHAELRRLQRQVQTVPAGTVSHATSVLMRLELRREPGTLTPSHTCRRHMTGPRAGRSARPHPTPHPQRRTSLTKASPGCLSDPGAELGILRPEVSAFKRRAASTQKRPVLHPVPPPPQSRRLHKRNPFLGAQPGRPGECSQPHSPSSGDAYNALSTPWGARDGLGGRAGGSISSAGDGTKRHSLQVSRVIVFNVQGQP